MTGFRIKNLLLKCSVLLVAGVLGANSTSYASTVTYTLDIDPIGGNFQLFAEASSGDNWGLASFQVELLNIDFPVDLLAPLSTFEPGGIPIEGFTQNRVDSMNPVAAFQNTFSGTGAGIVYGFGQTAGALSSPPANTFVQQNYDAKLLLAQGTFNPLGPIPDFGNTGAQVFDNNLGVDTHAPTIVTAVIIPEPSFIALAMLGAMLFALRSHQRWLRVA